VNVEGNTIPLLLFTGHCLATATVQEVSHFIIFFVLLLLSLYQILSSPGSKALKHSKLKGDESGGARLFKPLLNTSKMTPYKIQTITYPSLCSIFRLKEKLSYP
jgi:hypothetical protein